MVIPSFADCVRGYEAGGFGARSNNGLGSAVGTEAYTCASAEVRFPFPFIPDNLGLSGAVFADAGLMFDPRFKRLAVLSRMMTIRASVGAGVLWDSPMGPLRVDFAYALNDKATDRDTGL